MATGSVGGSPALRFLSGIFSLSNLLAVELDEL